MSDKKKADKVNENELEKAKLESPQDNSGVKFQFEKTTTFIGPFPPPDVLKEYDRIVPGSARKIINMAHDQSTHRRNMEEFVITNNSKREDRAQWMAYSLAIILPLLATSAVVWGGYQTFGSVLGGATVTGLVAVFITGKLINEREIETKKKQDDQVAKSASPKVRLNGSAVPSTEDNSAQSLEP